MINIFMCCEKCCCCSHNLILCFILAAAICVCVSLILRYFLRSQRLQYDHESRLLDSCGKNDK